MDDNEHNYTKNVIDYNKIYVSVEFLSYNDCDDNFYNNYIIDKRNQYFIL